MDAEFLVASGNNPAYLRALRRHTQGIPQAKLNDPKIIDPLISKAMAETILLDWRGEVTMSGQKLEPTPENKLMLCNVRPFRDWLAGQANDFSNFQVEAEETETSDLKSGA